LTGCSLSLVKKQSAPATNNITTSSEKIATTTIDISDWQIHADNAIGVKVKFPADWHRVSITGAPDSFFLSNASLEDYNTRLNSDFVKNSANFKISIANLENNQTLEKWYEENKDKYFLSSIEEKEVITVAGLPAIDVKTITSPDAHGAVNKFENYFIARNNNVISVSFEYRDSYSDIYRAIFSSLEFFNNQISGGEYKISQNNILAKPINSAEINENNFEAWGNILVSYNDSGKQVVLSRNAYQQLGGSITGAVNNSEADGLIFLSATDAYAKNKLNDLTNRLFLYNTSNGDLTEFYSEKAKNKILAVRGMQGSKLIIQSFNHDVESAVCANIWLNSANEFLFIDLANIKSGLKRFLVPKDKIDESKQWRENCIKELSGKVTLEGTHFI